MKIHEFFKDLTTFHLKLKSLIYMEFFITTQILQISSYLHKKFFLYKPNLKTKFYITFFLVRPLQPYKKLLDKIEPSINNNFVLRVLNPLKARIEGLHFGPNWWNIYFVLEEKINRVVFYLYRNDETNKLMKYFMKARKSQFFL